MKVSDLVEKLSLNVLGGAEGLNREVTGGYTSDLLSDVMGNVEEGYAWITLQTHKNVMAIATLKEVSCVLIVRDLEADEATIEQSNEEGIPLLSTSLNAFELSGKIYQLLNS